MKRENMTHDDLYDELDRLEQQTSDMEVEIKELEFDLKEAKEDNKILNEILDEIYGMAEKAETLNQDIIDKIP